MNNKAFSLIELLVVVSIVAILAAIAFPVYTNYQKRAKVNASIQVAKYYINKAIEYRNKNGIFPTYAQILPRVDNSYITNGWMNVSNVNDMLCAVGYGGLDLDQYPQNRAVVQLRFKATSAPCTTDLSNQNALNFVMYTDASGTIRVSCGSWNTDSVNVFPANLMPANCTETNIQANY